MVSTPTPFYTTSTEPEQVFQEVRYTLALHPELLDASPEQLAGFIKPMPAVFEIEAMVEALRDGDGELLA
jgi:hypothetical protein